MPDAKIEWQTPVYRPDHTITVRAAPAWDVDVGGEYKQGKWVFSLPRDDANPFEFKFVLDFQHWQLGANLAVDGSLTAAFFPGQVTFPEGQNDVRDSFIYGLPDAENGVISRTFFAPDLEGQNYDVIVVGSGIGGGTLAEALSDRGLRTLVLEAGSYLFPTHIANLPVRLLSDSKLSIVSDTRPSPGFSQDALGGACVCNLSEESKELLLNRKHTLF